MILKRSKSKERAPLAAGAREGKLERKSRNSNDAGHRQSLTLLVLVGSGVCAP